MAKQIINLTEILIAKGIDLVLRAYPRYPHQIAFQDAEAFDHLAHYVSQRTQASYISIDPTQPEQLREQIHQVTLKQQQTIKSLIHDGIAYLLPAGAIGSLQYE